MVQTGRVAAQKDGKVQVCFERPEACVHCGACAGQKEHTLVEIAGTAPVGAMVEVEMPQGQVLKASMIAYVLPLLLLIAGISGGMLLGSEVIGAAAGIAAMAAAYLILRAYEKRLKTQEKWQPRIVRVLPQNETEENEHGNEADEG